MYLLFPIIFLIMILFFFINHARKKRILCKLCSMSCCEKYELLNRLIKPFGFCYDQEEDIFSSRPDAWQKMFGYGAVYDKAALPMNMIFDTEPIYFNYGKKTWLIQLWKGQYGINTGAEIGIYHAEGTIAPMLRRQTIFTAVEEQEMLPLEIRLFFGNELLFTTTRTHWWLTGFCMGFWAPPSSLRAQIKITFPDSEMCDSFLRALTDLGYRPEEFCHDCSTVYLHFTRPKSICANLLWLNNWREKLALWRTKMLCILFLKLTAPFHCTVDRILYLYYYLPSVFRRIICLRSFLPKRKERKYRKGASS